MDVVVSGDTGFHWDYLAVFFRSPRSGVPAISLSCPIKRFVGSGPTFPPYDLTVDPGQSDMHFL